MRVSYEGEQTFPYQKKLVRSKINGSMISTNFQFNLVIILDTHSPNPSNFASKWWLKFWWWILETTNHQFCPEGLKLVEFRSTLVYSNIAQFYNKKLLKYLP